MLPWMSVVDQLDFHWYAVVMLLILRDSLQNQAEEARVATIHCRNAPVAEVLHLHSGVGVATHHLRENQTEEQFHVISIPSVRCQNGLAVEFLRWCSSFVANQNQEEE